ncbi:MAG: uroporphyrinogen-III C-methyltransferase [Oscillibacter sp.]|jgi:uroporphyrin-III C-methyltransferase/precorrin-2 dehydrogenase/sirohydrochlorin ferrochelatase|nr:uroporphyrinogen-III C-methyltransferase [Oscillibacter sp.]
MGYFPFFMDLEGWEGLVAGGGTVALRKIEKLLPYGPRLTVAAPELLPEIENTPGLTLVRRVFTPSMLEGKRFVIAATDDPEANREIAALCRERGVLVNAVDDKEQCTFLFPALLKRGELTLGVSTAGASPSAAAWVRRRAAEAVPENFGELLDGLAALRPTVRQRVPEARRADVFARLLAVGLEEGFPLPEDVLTAILEDGDKVGKVYLVGAGCGAADLITLRGHRLLERCGAVVYDDLLDPALLDAAPEEAERIYVGKRLGRHSMAQKDINALLVAKAREGRMVVRLKGGDPFVFGRGGEEALALQAAGIPWEYVPGVTSAVAVPGEAGIPVTHRGVSRSFHAITAHTADSPDGLPPRLEELAGLEGTLVFLMGLSRLEELARRLVEAGMMPETPAAVISGKNAPRPMTVRGTVEDIAERAREAGVQAPAVILVGGSAELRIGG